MYQLFLSFGCGICFAFGAVFGIAIATFAKEGRPVSAKEVRDHHKRVEDRLVAQVEALQLIAECAKMRHDD